MEYTSQLFKCYSEHLNQEVLNVSELEKDPTLEDHFVRQRRHFFEAETLLRFERDSLPSPY
ncbi:ABC-three component system protein [Lysinibacillus sp. NPDC058147]|uniref:ABC-three component system protein n=1 Tax=unclassified Lysinibacillus TaxID=2636778 RepID=UPI0036D921A3